MWWQWGITKDIWTENEVLVKDAECESGEKQKIVLWRKAKFPTARRTATDYTDRFRGKGAKVGTEWKQVCLSGFSLVMKDQMQDDWENIILTKFDLVKVKWGFVASKFLDQSQWAWPNLEIQQNIYFIHKIFIISDLPTYIIVFYSQWF